MTDKLSLPHRKFARECVFFQIIVGFAIVIVVFIIWGMEASLSAFKGCITSIIPNIVFAFYAFRFVGADKNNSAYTSLKRGSILKFMLTVMLFILVLKQQNVVVFPFFVAYILVLFSGLFAPFFVINVWNKKWHRN